MQRLRELDRRNDADEAALAELSRLACAVGDLEPPPGVQHRVRAALAAVEAGAARKARGRQPVLAVLVLAAAAMGVAMSGGSWLPKQQDDDVVAVAAPSAERCDADRSIASSADPASAAASSAGAMWPAAGAELAGPAVAPPPSQQVGSMPRDADAVTNAGPGVEPPPRARRPLAMRVDAPALPVAPDRQDRDGPGERVRGSAAVPRIAAASSSAELGATSGGPPTSLVLAGLRALRQDGDPRAAAGFLDEYRARFPDGDIVEEALALAIEAHTALRDPETLALADEYLQRFPRGRFRATAEHARSTLKGSP